jgi:outer membrane protein OmpA-like peptidoglycan-associated protein
VSTPPAAKPVLCVLTEDQQRHYADGLRVLQTRGARLLVHTDIDAAFASLESDKPSLVLVGNWVEGMEGLEFLARMMRRFPEYDGRIVVLPDEGDPFPPMVHHRPHSGARSETVPTTFGEIVGWLGELAGGAAPGGSAGATAGAGGQQTRQVPRAGQGSGRRKGRSGGLSLALRLALPVAVAGTVFGVIIYLHGRGSEETTAGSGVAPAAATTNPSTGPVENRGSTDQVPRPTSDASLPATLADFRRGDHVTLPLRFPRGAGPYQVEDAKKLKEIIVALSEALRQDGRLKVEVGGHTSVGEAALGRTRAESVKPLLMQAGIDSERIVIRNHGSRMRAVRVRGDDERNRRVTVRVVADAQ